MKIKYLNCDGEHKLFSFYQHDYVTWESSIQKEGLLPKFYMLDGGITLNSESYSRYSGGTIEEAEIQDVIVELREQFTWGNNQDAEGNPKKREMLKLKNISSSHCLAIIEHLAERRMHDMFGGMKSKDMKLIAIFTQELQYRLKNNII